MATDILLVTPPFTQLNTPYPATTFLKGFLQKRNYTVSQMDLGIETICSLFSRNSLQQIFDQIQQTDCRLSHTSQRILNLKEQYINTIEPVVAFLQGKDVALAHAILNNFLPRGKRFDNLPDLEWLFGTSGLIDKAKYLATLYLEDLGDFITENVDPHFGFSRYAERISSFLSSFNQILPEIESNSIVTQLMLQLFDRKIQAVQPQVVAITVPFPGNFLSALQIANHIKKHYPQIVTIMGGGFVNTELRQLNDPQIFNYFDYITLDDGERPLLQLLQYILKGGEKKLTRTFQSIDQKVVYHNTEIDDIRHNEIGAPDYDELPLDQYISVIEIANPMHRLWSDGRWNKLMIAHGCYWHKCSFCDVSLDYIRRYSQTSAVDLCDRVEAVIQQTKQYGFHFVDEAAPPRVLKEFALELLRRNIKITWWANIRFEKAFSRGLCQLLAASGCIAVSGGLEVASDRLLQMMNKGVTVDQVARVTNHFQQAGIMVHAYLMYGFPTETEQETIDSLEIVRQLFQHGLIQSGFWHRFAMTVHSPVGIQPDKFNVERITEQNQSFTQNECTHTDPTGADHGIFAEGLRKALYNYMHEMCLDFPLSEWFDFQTPQTKIAQTRISDALHLRDHIHENQQILWLGNKVNRAAAKKKKAKLFMDTINQTLTLEMPQPEADFIQHLLAKATLTSEKITIADINQTCITHTGKPFMRYLKNKNMKKLLANGLVLL